MKLDLGKKKILIHEVNGFFERYKTLKFELKPLKEGFLFKNRKFLSTYFFCQKVDVVMTDQNHKILYLYPNLKTEKRIFYKRKVCDTYILPLGSCEHLEVGKVLPIILY